MSDFTTDYENDGAASEEQIIDEFLGEHPRARELRLMRAVLEERCVGVRKELERESDAKNQARLQQKIKELNRQIEAVRQEEAITEFVEASVRVTLNKGSLDDE